MKIKNLKVNEYTFEKYIEKYQKREMVLMYQAVGLVMAGGIAMGATDCENPLGLILILAGVYSAGVATDYRNLANLLLGTTNEENSKQRVKTKKDNK